MESSNAYTAAYLHGADVPDGRYSRWGMNGVDTSNKDNLTTAGVSGASPSSVIEDISRSVTANVTSEACSHAYSFGSRLLEEGGRFLQKSNLIGEGPKPLRALCFLGGVAMCISSALYLFNIFSFITAPTVYILQLYELLFGFLTLIIEAKDMKLLENLKTFISQWMKFLTVPGGKGIFYFFIGSVGISIWDKNILLFVGGIYMAVMGIICILVHMGLRRQLRMSGIEPDIDGDVDVSGNPQYPEIRPPMYSHVT